MKYPKDFLSFIKNAISPYHAVDELKKMYLENGYQELFEAEAWNLKSSSAYFVIRSNSSILAFKTPSDFSDLSFNMVASHTDSPTFKLKPNYLKENILKMNSLDTEPYGGMIYSSWLDRPISLAGRVTYVKDNKVISALYDYDKAFVIPNAAIHQNRTINDGYKYNPQIDLQPLVGANFNLNKDISMKLGIDEKDIKSCDILLYSKCRGMICGASDDLIIAPQIDNLECAYLSAIANINSKNNKSVNLCVAFNNEEVGSLSYNGASSTFLKDTIKRICKSFGLSSEEIKIAISKSFMVSADNAHSTHPNLPSLNDSLDSSYLNGGIVIKTAANLSYSTDSVSKAIFEAILDKANVKHQVFANKSDVRGGSTLGRLSLEQVSVPTVDIGLAELAMHSCMETAGTFDLDEMVNGLTAFYNTHITKEKDEYII